MEMARYLAYKRIWNISSIPRWISPDYKDGNFIHLFKDMYVGGMAIFF